MRQSDKELGVLRGAGRLLHLERREAIACYRLDGEARKDADDSRGVPASGACFLPEPICMRTIFFIV